MEPSSFLMIGTIELFIKLNTPSGKQYQLTNLLDIVQIRKENDEKSSDDPYITFTEPNGRTYDIYFRNDDHGYHPFMVKGEYRKCYYQCPILYSFVGPNGIMYRVDHIIKRNNEIPVLVAKKRKYSDLQIIAVIPQTYHTKYVKYVFSNNGSQLFYRANKIDWTPLNKQPSLPVDEVAAGSELIAFPFLSFYSPSGKNYHIITNGTKFNIVVEEGINTTQPSYISFLQKNGKKSHIYYSPGDHPYIEEEGNPTEMKDPLEFSLRSFVTPDRKKYSMEWTLGNQTELKLTIELPSQAKDPVDEITEDSLSIIIKTYLKQYTCYFSWSGDKLIKVEAQPEFSYRIDRKDLISLIGK